MSEKYLAAESRALSLEIALEELKRVKLLSQEESVAKLARLTSLCAGGERIWKHIDYVRELWECIEHSPEFLERFRWLDGYIVALDVFLNHLLSILELEKPASLPPNFPRPRNLAGPHYFR
jgi:hypothetical protein